MTSEQIQIWSAGHGTSETGFKLVSLVKRVQMLTLKGLVMGHWHFLRNRVRVEVVLRLALVELQGHVRSARAANLAFFFQPLDYVYFDQVNQLVLSKVVVSFLGVTRRKLVVNVAVKTKGVLLSVLLIFIFTQ